MWGLTLGDVAMWKLTLGDVAMWGLTLARLPLQSQSRGWQAGPVAVRVSGFGFRVSGFGSRVSGLGFGVLGFGFRVLKAGTVYSASSKRAGPILQLDFV